MTKQKHNQDDKDNINCLIESQKSYPSKDKIMVLKERAAALSKEREKDLSKKELLEIVEFQLAKENYGIESAFIREVYPLNDFTTLPNTPPFIVGIINVRGQIVSIVNLKKFFNIPEKGIGELNKVIIIKNNKMEFGILADIILGTKLIDTNSIKDSFTAKVGITKEYLKGIAENHLIILNVENILNDEKMIINQMIE